MKMEFLENNDVRVIVSMDLNLKRCANAFFPSVIVEFSNFFSVILTAWRVLEWDVLAPSLNKKQHIQGFCTLMETTKRFNTRRFGVIMAPLLRESKRKKEKF